MRTLVPVAAAFGLFLAAPSFGEVVALEAEQGVRLRLRRWQ
jgi:hypothetical protein